MRDETKQAYLKLAANFYKNNLAGQPPTPKRIADALHKIAPNYRPNYWRRLRNAIECDQRNKGFDQCADVIAVLKNPVLNDQSKVKKKQRRIKSITTEEYNTLLLAAAELNDHCVCAMALAITNELGCRPAELLGLEILSENEVLIKGVKKTGNRGADRRVMVSPFAMDRIRMGCKLFKMANIDDIKIVQNRLWRLAKNLWPQRKHIPTLYSLRHQIGADLKAAVDRGEMEIADVAYIMGHQSIESCSVYGDRRTSRRKLTILPSPSADLSKIRGLNLNISPHMSI